MEIDNSEPRTRLRCPIFPTAKVTNAFNSSKLALKLHKVAADAQRAVEAWKTVELKAKQHADATADSADIAALACPLNTPLIPLSHSSS